MRGIQGWVGSLILAVAACGPRDANRQCASSMKGPLVTHAAMLRFEVYGPAAYCAGGLLAPGAPAPLTSHDFAPGEQIRLDVTAGAHVLVVTSYTDDIGTRLLGQGCIEQQVARGGQLCFDIALVDPAGVDGGMFCTPMPDDCPSGQYCDGLRCRDGCKDDSDCVAGHCDPTTHTCQACVTDGDCGTAPGAACCDYHCTNTLSDVRNCHACGQGCAGGQSCCSGACAATDVDPHNCGGCGQVCASANVPTPSCAAGSCDGACAAGFADCDRDKLTDGCETDLASPGNCGGCGVACDTTTGAPTCVAVPAGYTCQYGCAAPLVDCNSGAAPDLDGCEIDPNTSLDNCGGCGLTCSASHVTPQCTDGLCSGACASDFFDCNNDKRGDGCECAGNGCCGASCQTAHDNGLGQVFYDCSPLNTYDKTQAMEACQAWQAAVGSDDSCVNVTLSFCGGMVCSSGSCNRHCWGFSGSGAGWVTGDNCKCPDSDHHGHWN